MTGTSVTIHRGAIESFQRERRGLRFVITSRGEAWWSARIVTVAGEGTMPVSKAFRLKVRRKVKPGLLLLSIPGLAADEGVETLRTPYKPIQDAPTAASNVDPRRVM